MKLTEVPTAELRRIVAATERVVGPNSAEVRVLKRELARRQPAKKRKAAPIQDQQGAAIGG
jgi:hypothetical protein